MEVYKKIYPADFLKKFLEKNIRPDGRLINKIRKTTVSVGSITSAHGSSYVKVGNTTIICGVRGEVGKQPTSESNIYDQRQVVVNVELLPLCSPHIIQGKPSDQAQIVGQYLNDVIKNILDVETLRKDDPNGNYAWYLYVDVYCLDHDGSILDASLIAVVAALSNTKLPNVELKPSGEIFVSEEKTNPIQLKYHPTSLTFGIFEGFYLVDPTSYEEALLSGSVSLIFDENGNLCTLIELGSSLTMEKEKFEKCSEIAKKRAKQILNLINKSTR